MEEDEFRGNEAIGGLTRSARHFHTPLLDWDRAGLGLPPLPRFMSSVRWAQADQGVMGRFAWRDTRMRFFSAATAPTDAARQQAYAETFLGLGHLMHLVADLAQPAHTRDESHALGDDFEAFMAEARNFPLINGYRTFDPAIVQVPTNDAAAPVPVANIWDANRYDGTNPPDDTTGPLFGLAEFSNANFFSPGTLTPRAHTDALRPLPALDLLDLASVAPYVTGENRPYRGKSGHGLRVDRLVAEGVFHRFLPPFVVNFALDDAVFHEYAGHLLPRAIGYAAGLLEYFFRGRIDVAPPARFAYGVAPFQPGHTGAFTALRFKVRNATPQEDAGPGHVVAVLGYRRPVAGASLIDDPFAPIAAERSYAVSQPIALTLTAAFQELAFDFSHHPIPANAADVFLTVVYRGRLGLEDDAVIVGGRDLFEPAPLDVANGTDWDCFDGTLYPVWDLTAFPPHGPGQPQRDLDGDGAPDLAGPVLKRDTYVKVFDLADPVPTPSDTHFDLRVPLMAPAAYGRVMLLQDRPLYGVAALVRETQDLASGGRASNWRRSATPQGVLNDVAPGPGGLLVRRITGSSVYRGVATFQMMTLMTAESIPCAPQTVALEPFLTRVDAILPAD